MTDKEIIIWWNDILDKEKDYMLHDKFYPCSSFDYVTVYYCSYFDYVAQHEYGGTYVDTYNICNKCPFKSMDITQFDYGVGNCPIRAIIDNSCRTETKLIIVTSYLINEFRKFDIVTWYRAKETVNDR